MRKAKGLCRHVVNPASSGNGHAQIKCTASSAWLDLLGIQATLTMFCYSVLPSRPLFLFSRPILFMATALMISPFCFEALSWDWIASGSMGVQALSSSVRTVSLCDLKSGHLPSCLEGAWVRSLKSLLLLTLYYLRLQFSAPSSGPEVALLTNPFF